MSKSFGGVYTTVSEKDEHKKSKQYKQLSPKMRKAVDEIFKKYLTPAQQKAKESMLK